MIAVDTSSWIAFFEDAGGRDTRLVEQALTDRQVCMPPAVLTELLSDPRLPVRVEQLLGQLPVLEVLDGYWQRAGALRAKVIRLKGRAPLADALIAQSCLDHEVALVTRDSDFQRFARAGGLRILEGG
jgi:predicted nucleic acid-binding protein